MARIVWFLELSAFVKLSLVIGMFVVCVISRLVDRLFKTGIFGSLAGICYIVKIPLFYILLIVLMVIRWNDVPGEHLFLKTILSILIIMVTDGISYVML